MKPIRTGWKIWPPVIIVRYWLVQGCLYMNWYERIHRWAMELVVFFVAWWLLADLEMFSRILLAFLVAHTCSMLFNGHLFAMLTHDLFWLSLYRKKKRFVFYIDEIYARLNRKQPEYVAGVVFFGSLTRGVFRESSDLDIRFVANDGFWNAMRTAHLVFIERLHALFAGYPIDTYMFITEQEIHYKMDVENERPVCVYECGEKLRETLPETTGYMDFRGSFLAKEHSD